MHLLFLDLTHFTFKKLSIINRVSSDKDMKVKTAYEKLRKSTKLGIHMLCKICLNLKKKKRKLVTGIYLRDHQQKTCDTIRQPSQNCLVCISHPPQFRIKISDIFGAEKWSFNNCQHMCFSGQIHFFVQP